MAFGSLENIILIRPIIHTGQYASHPVMKRAKALVDIHGPLERSGLPLIRARIGILPLMPESMTIRLQLLSSAI
ncbi:unnamed protein product [Penicillium roqueforti FM164]|uniref:Genomic scaffold, ProqFM164S03 n=1 Tax=Penicillium roqueforti (strain FM164) TaxID=1365484 RepID=W6QIQ7_PENRF|nr:unnamed protein product [Penicillium roqueforti FM164]